MARSRTATAILDARGAFAKDPQRKRPDEPKVSTPFPRQSPDHLSPEESACWVEIVGIAPAGVLTGADTVIVEMVACLLAEYRKDREGFAAAKLTRLSSEINRIGLSPSSRAALTVDKPKDNEFDDV